MKNEKKSFIKEHKMGVFVALSAIIMLIGLSYAWLQLTLKGTKELTIMAAGTLYLELDDTMSGGITMSNAIPISDQEGLTQDGYTFTLENKGKVSSDYTIYLDDLDLSENQTRMNDSTIKYELIRDGSEVELQLLSNTGENPKRILDSGNIAPGEKYTYELKMWIDEMAGNEVMGTIFKGQLRIEAVQNVEQLSAVEILLAKANKSSVSYENATASKKKELFTFSHEAGTQQSGWSEEELTDYRYIGLNPNNYVKFNDELWRIIGVFTVEDESGKKEQRIKIIRNQSIGKYSWDNKPNGTGSSGSDYGSNDWSDSRLQQVLNSGPYYKRQAGSCPFGSKNTTTACDFTSNGLTETAKSMIGRTKWYLGGVSHTNLPFPVGQYVKERSTDVYSKRPTNWIGEVGLMYLSDYEYAVSKSDCLTTSVSSYESCLETSWLTSLESLWLISSYSTVATTVFHVSTVAGSGNYVYIPNDGVRPSVYLKSHVTITRGNGSAEKPYELNVENDLLK